MTDQPAPVPLPVVCPHGLLVAWYYRGRPDQAPSDSMTEVCRWCSPEAIARMARARAEGEEA